MQRIKCGIHLEIIICINIDWLEAWDSLVGFFGFTLVAKHRNHYPISNTDMISKNKTPCVCTTWNKVLNSWTYILLINQSDFYGLLIHFFLIQFVNWELSLNSLAFILHCIKASDSLVLSTLHDYVADILEWRSAKNDLQESSLSGNYNPTSLHREGILSTYTSLSLTT